MGQYSGILFSVLGFFAAGARAQEVELDATAPIPDNPHALESHSPEPAPAPLVGSAAKWVSGTPDTDPKCVLDPNDPGSIGPVVIQKKMLGKGYTGACIDEETRRPLLPLPDASRARFAAQPDEVVVGNFSCVDENGKRDFGVAKYRPEDLEPGGALIEHFDEHLHGNNPVKKLLRKLTWKTAHVASVACFKPGKELSYYPENGRLRLPPRKIQCIEFSAEAVPVKGLSKFAGTMLLVEGFRPKSWQPFALTMRGMCLDYKRDEVLKSAKLGGMGRTVDLIPTTADFTHKFFRNYATLAGQKRSMDMYSTLSRSCVTDFNDVVEMGLSDRKLGAKERKNTALVPGNLEKSLVAIGARDYQRPIISVSGDDEGAIRAVDALAAGARPVELPADTSPWSLSLGGDEIMGPPVPRGLLKRLRKQEPVPPVPSKY